MRDGVARIEGLAIPAIACFWLECDYGVGCLCKLGGPCYRDSTVNHDIGAIDSNSNSHRQVQVCLDLLSGCSFTACARTCADQSWTQSAEYSKRASSSPTSEFYGSSNTGFNPYGQLSIALVRNSNLVAIDGCSVGD